MNDALSGFSNKSMLAVGVLFVVVSSIERSQLVPWAARVVLGTKTSELPLCSSPPLILTQEFNGTLLIFLFFYLELIWGIPSLGNSEFILTWHQKLTQALVP